jgi:hypothetical protein
MKTRKLLAILIFLLLSAGCSKINGLSKAPSPPTPQAGKATVIGQVISAKTGKPVLQPVRLAEVVRQGGQGAYILDTRSSPGADPDQNGNFVFPSVDAKEYVVMVGDPYSVYEIMQDTTGKPRTWVIPPDKITNIGVLKLTKFDQP